MADFRKWLYAFVAIAILAGMSIPASAQTFMQCAPNPNNPLIRAEGYTELAGDLFITCTGGTPTASGSLVPKVTITVFVSTPITSKIVDTGQNPAFNEALLVVDEAGAVGSANPILNCGSATAPYGTTPFTCDTISPAGNGTGVYNGTAGHPNVFQARQVNNSGGQAIQFIGVPIDAPGTVLVNGIAPTRTLRITNVRVNAVALNVTLSQGFSLVTVNATVAFNGTNFGGNQILNVPIATVRPGLVVTSGLFDGDDALAGSASFLQCNASRGVTTNALFLTEGFPSAFKVRNWAQIQTNGVPPTVSGGDWIWNATTATISPVDLNQNVPNALYNTESGLEYPGAACTPQANPVPNPPTGASSGTWPGGPAFSNVNGICLAGSASQGTRFAIQLSNVPVGSNPSVPLILELESGTGDNDTGVVTLVCGNDANGAGGTPGSCANNGAVPGTWLVPSTGLIVYEVAFDNPNALEYLEVPFYVNPTINLNANPPIGGTPQVGVTATAQASFAPFYPASAQGFAPVGAAQPMSSQLSANGAPIPRFRQDFQPTPPLSLYTYSKCACDMLFPWVVADATYTTSLIVANTSLDACAGTPCQAGFQALPQSGNVTFWFFGTTDVTFDSSNGASATPPGPTPANVIGCQTTAAAPAPCAPAANTTPHPVPPGSYVAFIVSPSGAIAGGQTAKNNLGPIVDGATGKVATNFAGYVIAQSEFQYCHGVANLSASGFSNTYVGLILDKAGRGMAGIQLRRTVQQFADELNN